MPITFVNNVKTFMNDVRTLLRAEFDAQGYATFLGDPMLETSKPCLVIEPIDADMDSEFANNEKEVTMTVDIYVYLFDAQDENAIIRITATTENLIQLLLNNKKYPAGNGTSWSNSFVGRTDYGFRLKERDFFRASKTRFKAVKYAAR